ncbi:hypothetical protein ADL19_04245 [Streptomyces purpurogeneiscleroticus]|nr:hypothetical protein ADL19_04245 [Streptomyces purpurogeneiscleroticus]
MVRVWSITSAIWPVTTAPLDFPTMKLSCTGRTATLSRRHRFRTSTHILESMPMSVTPMSEQMYRAMGLLCSMRASMMRRVSASP